jgi:HAD superfamily phosphatase (TIGR01668 family)
MAFGVPDYIFRDYSSVTPEFLKSIGVKLVICDIDNTIAPYEVAVPDAQIEAWFTSMKDAGITFVFVSNNHAERAELFNQSLGLKVYADAKKPLTKALTQALSDAGLSPKDGASLGDQIFTDVLAGQFRGLQTILVPPIKDKTNLFFRSKRVLERPFIAAYFKKHPDEELLAYWNLKTRNLKEQSS